ncbi:MAG: hypothetical protein H0T40_13010 [Geodermatophilaceae bacterium]|nr:hypothetical protein [Geodermatophilaceae bacterium]
MTNTDFYPADTRACPEKIRQSAERLQAISGVLLGHGDNVRYVLSEVALSFSEVIAPAVAAQIGDNVVALETAVEGTQYGYAVGMAWAADVEAFLAARHELIARWQIAEIDDFGVPAPLNLWPPPQAAEAERLRLENRVAVEDARSLALDRFIREGHVLWENFQDRVLEKARMFREGTTADNLALVVSFLGWGAMTLWPEIAPPPVSATDGVEAGTTVVEGLDGAAGPRAVAGALADVAAIIRRAESGKELTSAEIDFLAAFYETVGERVTELPGYLAQTTFTYTTSAPTSRTDDESPPVYATHTVGGLDPTLVTALTAASANGMLVLSRSGSGGGGYARLPTWVRDSLDDPIVPSTLPTPPTAGAFESLVQLGELLEFSTVEAGDGLSREMADALNRMFVAVEGLETLGMEGTPTWGEQVDATGQSFLDVIARNDGACFDVVTGSRMPYGYNAAQFVGNMYSFEWSDDGASAASLTDFIPLWAVSDDPVQQGGAQTAMFDLVQIVTGDENFELLMDGVGTSGVAAESAVGQVNPAITQGFVAAMAPFMDQFAAEQTNLDPNAVPTDLRDLPFDTRVRFTTLIGTDQDSATALAGLAYAYEQQELSEYAVSGNTEVNGGNVGRIRGIVDAGLFNAEIDAGADQSEAEAAAARSRQLGADITQGVLGAIPAPGVSGLVDTVFAVIDSQARDDGSTEGPTPSPTRTEAERRYDTATGVMTGLVTNGQIPASAMPIPSIRPVTAENELSTDELTQALVNAAAAAGYDLNLILNRIESAYSDPDLVDERAGQ